MGSAPLEGLCAVWRARLLEGDVVFAPGPGLGAASGVEAASVVAVQCVRDTDDEAAQTMNTNGTARFERAAQAVAGWADACSSLLAGGDGGSRSASGARKWGDDVFDAVAVVGGGTVRGTRRCCGCGRARADRAGRAGRAVKEGGRRGRVDGIGGGRSATP